MGQAGLRSLSQAGLTAVALGLRLKTVGSALAPPSEQPDLSLESLQELLEAEKDALPNEWHNRRYRFELAQKLSQTNEELEGAETRS